MARPYNFSPGPSALPESVLRQAAEEMMDWRGSGMSVMEMSHRGEHFVQILGEAEADLRALTGVSDDYAVIFFQGGATGANGLVPLNLLGTRPAGVADYAVTGSWSRKSLDEAQRYGDVALAATSEAATEIDGVAQRALTWVPSFDTWQVRPEASYLHVCSNETIGGVEMEPWPVPAALGAPEVPLVVDASSNFLSRPMSFDGVGMVYAGAQKNAGPAGVSMALIRRDLLGQAHPLCPAAFNFANIAAADSCYNTPPTYPIYLAGLVFKWALAQGGLEALAEANRQKAALLYDYIDSSAFYDNPVHASVRSRMNVPFLLADKALDKPFLAGADAAGLLTLKGHKSVGGMRASIYNAMPLAGVQALVDYLREFERTHG